MTAPFKYRAAYTGTQAFGFYVVFLVLILVGSAIIGYFIGRAFPAHAFQVAAGSGDAVCALACGLMALVILAQKSRLRHPWAWWALLSLLLGGGSAFLGLIVPALLTRLRPLAEDSAPGRARLRAA